MRTTSAFTTVRCPECNEPRRISARQARRGVTRCKQCRDYPFTDNVTDSSLAWWFRRYNDKDLAEITSDFAGRQIPVEGVTRQREILVASGALREPR
jgi:hypothetical protein